MIVLLTDFGVADPYVGQVHLRLAEAAPAVRVVDLFHGLPSFAVQASAYLVDAYCQRLPPRAVVMAVVDPGVGGLRQAIAWRAGGRCYVGPDNGLFEMVARREGVESCQALAVPEHAAPSFHGRDVFAPAAAALARGLALNAQEAPLTRFPDWPDEWARVLFIDHYGNAVTGLKAHPSRHEIEVADRRLRRARTFSEGPRGEPFFYENADGLIEIAAYEASAAGILGLRLADPLRVLG
ncbi:SAM hydrolase/SAM-dependent halogenase family protein [Acidiferrobacter sp.]